MKLKSLIKWVGIILILLIVATLVGNFLRRNIYQGPLITFEVTVPSNTPQFDTIVLHLGTKLVPMNKTAPFKYKAVINPSDYNYDPKTTIYYGYSRGGFVPFGENNFNFGTYPRSLRIGTTYFVQDVVKGWKWYPSSGSTQQQIPSQMNTTSIASRNEYWKGVAFVDFWDESWPLQYNSTLYHLKQMGYNWIEITPPWDITNINLPTISNQNASVPTYPDNQLSNEINYFKQNGFKILLAPEVCCTVANTTSQDANWWNNWYTQYENFVSFHANLAKQEGVDAIMLSPSLFGATLPLDGTNRAGVNATQKWDDILTILKSSGAKIGFNLVEGGISSPNLETSVSWPGALINFYNQLDFIGISLGGDMTNQTNPSQQNIDQGMSSIFKGIDYTHNYTGLNVVLTQIAYSSETGSGLPKGPQTLYTFGDPSKVPFTYNSTQQAMIYESIMKNVANRSYIIGSFPYGYWYTTAPLTVDDLSIRGKTAEWIYSGWLRNFQFSSIANTNLDIILTNLNQFNYKIHDSFIPINLYLINQFILIEKHIMR